MAKRGSMKVKAVALACAAATAACASGEQSTGSGPVDSDVYPESVFGDLEGTLTWYDGSGGFVSKAKSETVFRDFSELTGVSVQAEFVEGGAGKFAAAAEQGVVPWNLVEFAPAAYFIQARDAGHLVEIDPAVVPVDKLEDLGRDDFGIPVQNTGALLAWNADSYPEEKPTRATDIFDTETFPGKRCLFQYGMDGGVLETALLADGVAPEDLYPIDMDRAMDKLEAIKDDIVWWTTGTSSMQYLSSGECDMGLIWQGQVFSAVEEQDLPIEFSWEGAVMSYSYFAVPKDAPNPEIGMAALAMWILDEDAQVDYVNRTTYTTSLSEVPETAYSDKVRPYIPTSENTGDAIFQDAEWYGANLDEVFGRLIEFATS